MTNDLVTVVVPVYNVEKYLDRCVNSIVNQTYRNLEIILVDDGSPDNCPAMCDEWAKKDSRIRVIHKQNEGQGVARNVGIENATGDYIYFMDSDDYIDLTTIEKACDLAKQHNADVVCFGLLCVNSSGEIVSRGVPNTAKLIYEGESVYSTFLLELYGKNPINGKESNLRSTLWTHFINKKLIQDSAWRIVSEKCLTVTVMRCC